MDNRPFFNPYGMFGNFSTNMIPPPSAMPGPNLFGTNVEMLPLVTLKEFYDNQFMYYRYLSQMMDYTIKNKEMEKYKNDPNKKEI